MMRLVVRLPRRLHYVVRRARGGVRRLHPRGKLYIEVGGKIFLRASKKTVLLRSGNASIAGFAQLENARVWKLLTLRPRGRTETFDLMSDFPEGRLGNRILELVSGISVLRELCGERFLMLHRRAEGDETLFLDLTKNIDVMTFECRPDRLLCADSQLAMPGQSLIFQANFLNSIGRGIPSVESLRESFTLVRKSLQVDEVVGTKNEIILHFRGTDRLEAPSSRNYRPAPLAYFEKAVSLCEDASAAVRIVTDDPESIIVSELVSRLAHVCPSVRVQSADLETDFGTLLSAKTLILSGSSLGDAAAGISQSLERLFVFDKEVVTRDDIEVIDIYDPSGNWDKEISTASDVYRKRLEHLMISFPIQDLHFRKVF